MYPPIAVVIVAVPQAYIQQLETSRIKLAQLEQDLQRARQQGVYANGNMGDSTLGFPGSADPGETLRLSICSTRVLWFGAELFGAAKISTV
jgi:hypothetical protein